jgi:hypothetical protein
MRNDGQNFKGALNLGERNYQIGSSLYINYHAKLGF